MIYETVTVGTVHAKKSMDALIAAATIRTVGREPETIYQTLLSQGFDETEARKIMSHLGHVGPGAAHKSATKELDVEMVVIAGCHENHSAISIADVIAHTVGYEDGGARAELNAFVTEGQLAMDLSSSDTKEDAIAAARGGVAEGAKVVRIINEDGQSSC